MVMQGKTEKTGTNPAIECRNADCWFQSAKTLLCYLKKIAHDRRGHGRAAQTATGNDVETYAADVAQLTAFLDRKDAIHIGHSTGGGEVIRYAATLGRGRVAKAVLISAAPPSWCKMSLILTVLKYLFLTIYGSTRQRISSSISKTLICRFLDITRMEPMFHKAFGTIGRDRV